MQKIFSVQEAPRKSGFRLWTDFADEYIGPMVHQRLDGIPFHAEASVAAIGDLFCSEVAISGVRCDVTSALARDKRSKTDKLWLLWLVEGVVDTRQGDLASKRSPGDLTIYDTSITGGVTYDVPTRQIALEFPRERLEGLLGSAKRFAGLVQTAALPTTVLARTFLSELLRQQDKLAPEAAERMGSICIDLIVASIAERMALDVPKSLLGTIIVQRAKAYIENNLGSPGLNPPQVAAAVGVSQRHLHDLFRRHGRTVAAWIWHRRLECAAHRLSDPALAHVPLGTLAYSCGFADQAHFSRRFRERYGMTPRDYRHVALGMLRERN